MMNRHQRRAAAKATKNRLSSSSLQLEQALEAVKQLQGLEGVTKLVQQSYDDLQGLTRLMDVMVDDIQTLSDEAEDREGNQLRLMAAVIQWLKSGETEASLNSATVDENTLTYLQELQKRLSKSPEGT